MKCFFVMAVSIVMTVSLFAENVLEDKEMGVKREEVTAIVATLNPNIVKKLGQDQEYRNNILLRFLMNKKMAAELDEISKDFEDEEKWTIKIALQSTKSRMYMKHFLKNIDYPDFEPLAKERYIANPKKYAGVDERRVAAQILIKCTYKECESSSKDLINKVEKELELGASFEDMVELYSQDELTNKDKGVINLPISKDDATIDLGFRKQLYTLKKVGDESKVFKTKYGYHIIKLVKVEKAHIKAYSEVKERIEKQLKELFRELSIKSLNKRFIKVKEVKFDTKAWDKAFEKASGK